MLVILLWAKYFGPKPPVQTPQANHPGQTAPATPGSSAATASTTAGSKAAAAPTTTAAAATASVPVRSDSQERTITIENNLYQVEISNQGAVVESWKLKRYLDDAKPQRVLDVVHPEASQQTGGWPFSLVLDDEQLQNAANGGLYQISADGTNLPAPADVDLTWSDGHLEVMKRFHFDHTYVVRVETSVKFNGNPIKAGLGWLGGFGDLTVTNPAPVETVTTYYSEGGKITNFPHKKLDGLDKWGPGLWQGGKDFVGIEDRYFTAAFLPPIVGRGDAVPVPMGALETRYWKASRTVKVNGQDALEPVPQVAVATSTQPVTLRRRRHSYL